MAEPPLFGRTYTVLVPQVDADGNPIDGLRNTNVQVPLGTYMGWNIRKAGFSEAIPATSRGPLSRSSKRRPSAKPQATRVSRWRSATRRMTTTLPKSPRQRTTSSASACYFKKTLTASSRRQTRPPFPSSTARPILALTRTSALAGTRGRRLSAAFRDFI
jgi:hypothetical protein